MGVATSRLRSLTLELNMCVLTVACDRQACNRSGSARGASFRPGSHTHPRLGPNDITGSISPLNIATVNKTYVAGPFTVIEINGYPLLPTPAI